MKINNIFLFTFFCIVPFFCNSQIGVTFFEVGQGHCTLICPDECGPIIVDGGSLSHAYTGNKKFKTTRIDDIVEKIVEHAQDTGTNEVTVIISHPDPDHYNWIEQIMKDCIARKVRIARVVLGCEKALYKQSFRRFLDGLANPPVALRGAPAITARRQTVLTYLTQAGDTELVTPIIQAGPFSCEILPAKKCGIKTDANDGSLVVLVNYGNISCLLMGDATGTTLDHILKYWWPRLGKLILQASHHGSETHGSNRDSWLDAVKPGAIVLSSGLQSGDDRGNRHPHTKMVSRALAKLPVVTNGPYHLVISGKPKTAPKENLAPLDRAHYKNEYRLGLVRQNIHGTLSQGTITYAWNLDDTEIPAAVPADEENLKSGGFDTEKAGLFAAILGPRYGCFAISALMDINISGMAIDDTVEADKTSLRTLLSRLVAYGENLRSFLADNNILQLPETMTRFIALLAAQKKVEKLSLQSTQFSDDQMARLRALDPRAKRVFISRKVAALAKPAVTAENLAVAPAKALPPVPVTPEKAKIRVSPCVASPLAVLNSD